MVKKELTLRERRKIYEDAVFIVAQTQKINDATPTAVRERAVQNMVDQQTNHCVSIIITVLGYHEIAVVSDDGLKKTMLLPEDNDELYTIEKGKFEEIVQILPKNKELREALWKTFIKRDKKAKAKFDSFVA